MTGGSPSLDRRAVLSGALAGAVLATRAVAAPAHAPLRAVAFDAFTIFDPRPIADLAEGLFPGQGRLLAASWAARLFASTWLVTSAERYRGFADLAQGALLDAAAALNLDLTPQAQAALVAEYAELPIWPDVPDVLAQLAAHGIRLAVLSNLGQGLLDAALRRTGLLGQFAAVLSTDRVGRFKPAPAAYRLAVDALELPREKIGFAAFAGWDAVGATWFGYRTAWINRLDARPEPFPATPAITSRGLDGVLALTGT